MIPMIDVAWHQQIDRHQNSHLHMNTNSTMSLPLFYILLFLILTSPRTQAAVCKLCGGDVAESIQNPDAVIPLLNIPGPIPITCQVAFDYAAILTDTDPACELLKQHAIFCQCPNAHEGPPEGEACTLCPGKSCAMMIELHPVVITISILTLLVLSFIEQLLDGSEPSHSDRSTPFGDTCGELNSYLDTFTKDQCQISTHLSQLLDHAFGCGCPNIVSECPMCAGDGTIDVAHPDRVVPFLSWNEGMINGGEVVSVHSNPTCQELAMLAAASSIEGNQLCEIAQAQAGFCGCAGVAPLDECSFCPDGSNPPNGLTTYLLDTMDSCGEIAEYMRYMTNEECQSERAADMKALGYICGCKDSQPRCTLCPDGSNDFVPDRVPVKDNDGDTCLNLALSVAGLTKEACDEQRKTSIGINAVRCGCPDAKLPPCGSQQNINFCTQDLVDAALASQGLKEEECECMAFCDGELVECQRYPVSSSSTERKTGALLLLMWFLLVRVPYCVLGRLAEFTNLSWRKISWLQFCRCGSKQYAH